MIALATTSRGARSASGCWPSMKRDPRVVARTAPSPRTASLTSGCWPVASAPSQSTVGWNCTNSRSATAAPARSASAMPSPVATDGLVERLNTWPSPPVARTTAGASTAPTPSRWPSPMTCSVSALAAPRSSMSRSSARAFSMRSMRRTARTAADERARDLRARRVTARVRDAVAEVAALAGERDVAGLVGVEARAEAMSRRTAPGPSVTSARTASAGRTGRRPRPGCRSRARPASRRRPRAAAMPPWAQRVEPSSTCALVTISDGG